MERRSSTGEHRDLTPGVAGSSPAASATTQPYASSVRVLREQRDKARQERDDARAEAEKYRTAIVEALPYIRPDGMAAKILLATGPYRHSLDDL